MTEIKRYKSPIRIGIIDSIGNSIQCLYLHPASGDNVHRFYTWNASDSKIFRISNIPSGTLMVLFNGTFNVMSCRTVIMQK